MVCSNELLDNLSSSISLALCKSISFGTDESLRFLPSMVYGLTGVYSCDFFYKNTSRAGDLGRKGKGCFTAIQEP